MSHRAMNRWLWAGLVVGLGCRGEAVPSAPDAITTAIPAPIPTVADVSPEAGSAEVPAGAASEALGPGVTVHNPGSVDLSIYGAWIVDEAGGRGTLSLWPDPYDCPDADLPDRLVFAGKSLRFGLPARAYAPGRCEPTEALGPGRYVLRLDSGYGEELYAAAPVELPLAGPVELRFASHDEVPPCDRLRARRAARLAFAAARAAGELPEGFVRECDVDEARCGSLPIDEALPPPRCTVTLHERLLRVERAAGDDAPSTLTAWLDRELVYAQRPSVDRSSASRVVVGGKPVVIAGTTSHHIHEHGGEAAPIGSATFRVHNPHPRALRLQVVAIERLTSHDCGIPEEVRGNPALQTLSPSSLPPGESEVVVAFASRGAYQAHCDRFATRVVFAVEGAQIAATCEHQVTRIEPLRR